MKSVMSVKGEIPARNMGLTLPHEHLFTDLSCYLDKSSFASDQECFSQRITPELSPEVRQKPWSFKDNIILNDVNSAISEAKAFQAVGGETIVDASPYPGMGRNPRGLLAASIAAGVNVIMSSGRYSAPSMNEAEKAVSIEELSKRFLAEFTDGAEGSGIKPGILKVGFVDKADKEPELRSLRAAGQVQHKVGCALSIHPHIWQPDSHLLLDILAEEGCDLNKVILCHQDFLGSQHEYLQSLVSRGCYIEFDTFGSGFINDRMWQSSEESKIENVIAQIRQGNTKRILLSGDMCMKVMLVCGGGVGLRNIPANTLPALSTRGINPETIHMISVENPQRVFGY
jgi:phosphotriesterase-related protein